jgi:hypothetical protein
MSTRMRYLTHTVVCVFLALVIANGLAGTASAQGLGHITPKPRGPQSCFWVSSASKSSNITINSVVVGTYSVYLQYYTCNTNIHQGVGKMVITGSNVSCSSASFNVDLDANGIGVETASASGSIGTMSCPNGTQISATTPTYSGPYTYCAEIYNVHFVINLGRLTAGSQCP